MIKIVHTIAGIQSSHGGTSRTVPALCESLARLGCQVDLITGRPSKPEDALNEPSRPVRIHWIDESPVTGRWLTGVKFQRVLNDLLANDPSQVVVHDNGLWLPSNHAVASVTQSRHVPRVVSPRGMLSGWAMGRRQFRKKLLWSLRQHHDLKSATAFHATSREEAADIRSRGLNSAIAIIPNGVSFPKQTPIRRLEPRRRMLFLSRLHPVKGLTNLIRAFYESNAGNAWDLLIAGPGEESYRNQIKRLVNQLGLSERVSFRDEVNDTEKWELYASADLLVLPSFSENFGVCIAEALGSAVPVLTTTATPWMEIQKRGAGWCVSPKVESLAEAISDATKLSREQLREMGLIGADWVHLEFQWDSIAEKMRDLYAWLANGGVKPDFVI